MSRIFDLETMPTNALWKLYDDLRGILISKITDERNTLESHLRALSKPDAKASAADRARPMVVRRPYPKVIPIYRNPAVPSETWSGRGNRPRWLSAQIASGRHLEEFLIKAKSGAHAKRTSKRR